MLETCHCYTPSAKNPSMIHRPFHIFPPAPTHRRRCPTRIAPVLTLDDYTACPATAKTPQQLLLILPIQHRRLKPTPRGQNACLPGAGPVLSPGLQRRRGSPGAFSGKRRPSPNTAAEPQLPWYDTPCPTPISERPLRAMLISSSDVSSPWDVTTGSS